MKKCPFCAEEIQDEAIYCRYCNHDLIKKAVDVDNRNDDVLILKNARSYLNKGFWIPWLIQICLLIIAILFGGLSTSFTNEPNTILNGLSGLSFFIAVSIFVIIRPIMCYTLFQFSKQVRHSQAATFFISFGGFIYPAIQYLSEIIKVSNQIKLVRLKKYSLPSTHGYKGAFWALFIVLILPFLIFIPLFSYSYLNQNKNLSNSFVGSKPTEYVEASKVEIFDDYSSVNNLVLSDTKYAKYYIEDGIYNIQFKNFYDYVWIPFTTKGELINNQENIEYSVDVRVEDRFLYENPSKKNIDIPIEYGFYLGSLEDNDFVGFTLVEWKGKIQFFRVQPQISHHTSPSTTSFTDMKASLLKPGNLLELQSSISNLRLQYSTFNKIGDGFIRISIRRSNNKLDFYINNKWVFETNLDHFNFETFKYFGFLAYNYGMDPQIQFDNLEIKTIPDS